MTADNREGSALDHAVAAVRKIRGYWVLATFTFGGAIWLYEAWQDFGPLPDRVEQMERRLQAVERQAGGQGTGGPLPCLLLPGMVRAGGPGGRAAAMVPLPLVPRAGCAIHDPEAAVTGLP